MHWLIVGVTGSGKSRIMRETVIPCWKRQGVAVAVLDPLGQRWGANYETPDPVRFLARLKASRRVVAVVDEWPHFAKDWKTFNELQWLATIARNQGILSYFLAQRAMQVHPNVRNQCSKGLIFRQRPADAAILADLFDCDAINGATQLPLGECMRVEPFKPPVKIKAF
jgi:hypothetical protein